MTAFFSGDKPTAQDMTNATAQGVIARARRLTSSAGATTTELGVLRIDGIVARANRMLVIETSALILFSTVAADHCAARIRVSTAGVATTASTPLGTAIGYSGTTFSTAIPIIVPYYPGGTDQTISVILTVARNNGTGTSSLLINAASPTIDLMVLDLGTDPGDTGVLL